MKGVAKEGQDYPSTNDGSGTIRSLKRVIVALIVVLMVLSSATVYLYSRSNASPAVKPSQPQFVHLIDPHQVSTIMGGNWSWISPRFSYNVSNPTGLMENEYLQTQTPTLAVLYVTVSGFNTTSFADFVYEHSQLSYLSLMNYTTKGLIASSENYTLFGICTQTHVCSSFAVIAISSLYVVQMSLSLPWATQQTSPVVTDAVVKSLLQAQLSEIKTS